MKKQHTVEESTSSSSLWTKILATLLVLILLLLVTEKFYHVPSRFFVHEEHQKIDIDRPTDTGTTLICTQEYAPVCGIDGKTYANLCIAKSQNMSIEKYGECESQVIIPVEETGAIVEESTGTLLPPPPESDTLVPRTPVTATGDTVSIPPEKTETFDTGAYIIYTNTSVGYELALPKYVYYSGYGARDSASHTLAISLTNTGVDTFEGADVRVYYYKGTAPLDVMAGATRIDTKSGVIIVDSANSTNPKVQKIVDTIRMSAE